MHKLFQILWNSAQNMNHWVDNILRNSSSRVAWEWLKCRTVTESLFPRNKLLSITRMPVGFARSQATESCGVLPPRAICAHSFISCSVAESRTTQNRWNLACLRWDGLAHARKHETLTKSCSQRWCASLRAAGAWVPSTSFLGMTLVLWTPWLF